MTIQVFDSNITFDADQETVEYFIYGQCNALAWEIHKLTGWDLILVSDDLAGTPDYLGHIAVINDSDEVVDIEGVKDLDAFMLRWRDVVTPYRTFHLENFHRFRSRKEFQKEMLSWENDIPYNRDPFAKFWAGIIVDTIS